MIDRAQLPENHLQGVCQVISAGHDGVYALARTWDNLQDVAGLGLVKGRVRLLEADRIPHMGWNEVVPGPAADSLFPAAERYYFVHSYGLAPADPSVVAAGCDYGGGFAAAIVAANVVATQFHPEKSGEAGLRLLARLRQRL